VGPNVGSDENVLPVELYGELRSLAERLMRDKHRDSVLQRTALVHEACLKLLGSEPLRVRDRGEILALASVAMRNLLVDRARTRNRQKRRANGERVSLDRASLDRFSLDKVSLAYENRAIDLVALQDALGKLETFDPEMARAVDLRFFCGLSMKEIAGCLSIPLRTLERRWEAARHWLRAEIG
jgi:RNA polymerase sigma factor (TIGR02999 family)